ncbi:MAG: 50S ribosomal protein L6 [Candidatus Riflebacteria bacterium]|nr:50S ribosomal protein L6 [Candidatus Riflebacteria bacterium]
MSRIGRKPIIVPKGVDVNVNGHVVSVKGPQGTMKYEMAPEVKLTRSGDHLTCDIGDSTEKRVRSLFGLVRSLVANMVTGVSQGWHRQLEIVGIGYKAKQEGAKVVFNVGYSHSVTFEAPKGVALKVEGTNKVVVSGIDKQAVGQVAADIRAIKPPEHYKGTGIRYAGEKVRIKEGKKLAA